jgi:hypothetical protein
MNSEEKVRATVISGLRAGRSVKDIVKFHNLKRTTVWDIKRRYDAFIDAGGLPEDFSSERKTHSRRSDAMDVTIVASLQELVDQDPGRSMRSLARELGISEASVRNKMAQDIRYKSYAFRRGQFMNEATKERRLAKAKLLLNRLKKPATNGQLIFFSDEKNFSQDQKINRKNNRWLCADVSEVPIVMSTKFPATVMVLGVVSNEGDVMPPHFFEKGLKINAQEYLKVMQDVVKPWMDTVANGRHYVFQQDGAPAHNAKVTQEWCEANLPEFWSKEVWPPSSPDCNPLDYYVWSVCERDVNRSPHNTAASLKEKITDVMANLPRDTVAKACRRFRRRIEAVVEAGGDFFE